MSQDTTMADERSSHSTPRHLGDRLVMRKATFEDRDRVADFHANTLLDIGDTAPLERLHAFVLDLMSGRHPTPGDFLVVEDTSSGKIVSSMCLISQVWSYDGIAFPFGQPDIVSTDPAFRRRGLVKAQLDEVHRWSVQRGEMVQGITGIPWYYRQFGYEYALSLEAGRSAFRSQVPRLNEGEPETYNFRPATMQDLPFMMRMYGQDGSRSLIAAVRGEALWRYDLEGRHDKSGIRRKFRVIETLGGRPTGLLVHGRKLWGGSMEARLLEVMPGTPMAAVAPGVMRYLEKAGEAYAQRDGGKFESISLELGERHPVYDNIGERLPIAREPYAWYIRVPELPAFVRHIAPALEDRLAASPQVGYTGELKISWYRGGLCLQFEDGRVSVREWRPERVEEGDAAFPDLTFLQLLFGYRSLEELRHAFPDCTASSDHALALLPVLFPRKGSNVWIGG